MAGCWCLFLGDDRDCNLWPVITAGPDQGMEGDREEGWIDG